MAFSNAHYIDARGSNFHNVSGDQYNIITIGQPASKDLNELLAPADAAYKRSGPVASCHLDTRVDLLTRIMGWVDHGSDRPICWLSGPAGSGKSAVSQTLAERCDAEGKLAASFFFFRGSGNRNKITPFISTLCYQLSIFIPATQPLIRDILLKDPSITRRALRHQFQKLMIEPALAVRDIIPFKSKEPMVLVIDALDECNDKEAIAAFLKVVIDACRENPEFPFQIFFASRVEEHIRMELEAPAAHSTTYPLALQDFDVNGDIRKFFEFRFSTIYEENSRVMSNVPLPWPSNSDLDALVQKASGSFVFACTLINLIDDGEGLPQQKLPIALTAHAGLDPLYCQVLSDAPRGQNFERVLSTIILLEYPLAITSLGHLLQLDTADIPRALLGLDSILMIPTEWEHPVQHFHISLRDFLTARPRAGDFFIDPLPRHRLIVIDCLKVISKSPKSAVFSLGVERYACDRWCHHFLLGLPEGGNIPRDTSGYSLMRCLLDFMSESFNSWINTLILHSQLGSVLNDLSSVLLRLGQFRKCPKNVVQVFEDVQQRAKSDETDWDYFHHTFYDPYLEHIPHRIRVHLISQTGKIAH